MYYIRIASQLTIILCIFGLLHLFLKYYLVKYCDLDRNNRDGDELEGLSRKEKHRMLAYPFLLAMSVTVFSIIFFYHSTNSIYHSINIVSILIGVAGTIFITVPSLYIQLPTYWNRVHRKGTFTEVLRQDKGVCLHVITGFYFIIIAIVIRFPFILQQ